MTFRFRKRTEKLLAPAISWKRIYRKKIEKRIAGEEIEDVPVGSNKAASVKTTKEKTEQMDTLDVTEPHYERKINDLQKRLDAQYDIIEEAENAVEEIRSSIA